MMNKKLLFKGVFSFAFLCLFIISLPQISYSTEAHDSKTAGDSTKSISNLISSHSNSVLITSASKEDAPSDIDFVGADPASISGAIVVEVSNRTYNSDGSATADIKVRNNTSLWYKLYVETVGDVDLSFHPLTLEDDQGKFLYLPPDGTSSFAYPILNETVTFNEPDAGIFFTADNSVESGLGALFLQQLEILSRASSAIPTLPHDEAGAIIEVIKAKNDGLGPFIDLGTAIYDGDVSGIMSGISALGRDPEAIAQLGVAFKELGFDVSVSTIKEATAYLKIISLSWYIAEFVGESIGSSSGDAATVKSFNFDDKVGPEAHISVSGDGRTAPSQISFDAGDSFSSEGIESYTWNFGDGSAEENGERVDHTFNQPGNYNVHLTVTDTQGNTDDITQLVQVFAPSFSFERQDFYEFNFTANADGNITGYSWDFGDGTAAAGRNVIHTFDKLGEYNTTLTLTLADGSSTEVTRTVYAGPQPVYVGDTYESDRVWPASHGPYIINTSHLEIGPEATLTIEPGAVVKFGHNNLSKSGASLRVDGELSVEGTPQDSIVFTSIRDDSYGGYVPGSSDKAPTPYDWGGIIFRGGSSGSIDHAIIRYGNNSINVAGTSPSITNSRIEHSSNAGILIREGNNGEPATPKIIDNSFRDNRPGIDINNAGGEIRDNEFIDNSTGITISGKRKPILGNNSKYGDNKFYNNRGYAVRNDNSSQIEAIGNFWNTTDPASIDNKIYDDDEDSGSGEVIFEPFLDEPPKNDDTDGDAPTITGIEPNPVTGSNSDQPISVKGSGFKDDAFVILDDLDDDQGPFENPSKTTFVSSTELTRQATFMENAATWSAQVENPDGKKSEEFEFKVEAGALGPSSRIKLTNLLVKQPSEQNFKRYKPSNISGVLTGSNIRFEGIVTDKEGNPVPDQEVRVYNSFQYAPDSGENGIYTVITNSDGSFTYPSGGNSINTRDKPSGSRPFWFNIKGTDTAIPFALSINNGEDSFKNINNILAEEAAANENIMSMRIDTSASNPFSDLVVRGQAYPLDDTNLNSDDNDAFFEYYMMVYRGPTGESFLLSEDRSSGWLKRGYEAYRIRSEFVLENLPERFQQMMPPTINNSEVQKGSMSMRSGITDLIDTDWANVITYFAEGAACIAGIAGSVPTAGGSTALCVPIFTHFANDVVVPAIMKSDPFETLYRRNYSDEQYDKTVRLSEDLGSLLLSAQGIFSGPSSILNEFSKASFDPAKIALESAQLTNDLSGFATQTSWILENTTSSPYENKNGQIKAHQAQDVLYQSANNEKEIDLAICHSGNPSLDFANVFFNDNDNPSSLNISIESDKQFYETGSTSQTTPAVIIGGKEFKSEEINSNNDQYGYDAEISVSDLPNFSGNPNKWSEPISLTGTSLESLQGSAQGAFTGIEASTLRLLNDYSQESSSKSASSTTTTALGSNTLAKLSIPQNAFEGDNVFVDINTVAFSKFASVDQPILRSYSPVVKVEASKQTFSKPAKLTVKLERFEKSEELDFYRRGSDGQWRTVEGTINRLEAIGQVDIRLPGYYAVLTGGESVEQPEPPATPSSFVLNSDGSKPILQWQKNSENYLNGYVVYSGNDPNSLSVVDTLSKETTSYSIDTDKSGYYALSAFDVNGNESPLSPWVSYVKDQLNISSQWQMVSNPATEEKEVSAANVFRFDGTYKEDSVLTAGKGYWVKSEQNQTVSLQDQGLDSAEIQLAEGWNLIGSLVDTLSKSAISDPDGVIGSPPAYGYDVENSKYEQITEFLPKHGYWLYADKPGPITLHFNKKSSTQSKADNLQADNTEYDRLIFSNETAERELLYFYSSLQEKVRQQYLLPPMAPAVVMDVRTPKGYKALDASSGEIKLTAESYPVQIRMEGQSQGEYVYQFTAGDGEDKKKLILTPGSTVMVAKKYGTIQLDRLSGEDIITENDLEPNYPNPFSSSTTIIYQVAQTSQVKLEVYDVIGRRVETLVDAEQGTGEYTEVFDASNLASGIYIIRLTIDDEVRDQKITLIK